MIEFFQKIIQKEIKKPVTPKWNAGELAPFGALPSGSNYNKINIWSPTVAGDRAYNHHCLITSHNGVIYGAFSTHNYDEDAGGQYIRGTYSIDDGVTFSQPYTLYQSMSDMVRKEPIEYIYRALTPAMWITLGSDLYLIAEYTSNSPGEGGFGVGVLAAKMNETTKQLETPFLVYSIEEETPFLSGYPFYDYNIYSGLILNKLKEPDNLPRWDYTSRDFLPNISNTILEGSAITVNDIVYRLWRLYPYSSKRKQLQTSVNGGLSFSNQQNTEIIDNPSVTVWKVLSNGKIAMMGNDTIGFPYSGLHRQNLFFALADEDLVFNLENIYDVETNIKNVIQFEGARKSGGASYVDFCEHNGKIISMYSEGKESIYVTTFDLMNIN